MSLTAIKQRTRVHMLLVCGGGRYVCMCVYTLSVCHWFWEVDMGRPSGQCFNIACWRDRPEHRLKLRLKLSDWQRSKKGERPLEIWQRASARLCPRRAHSYARLVRRFLSCHFVLLRVQLERQRGRKIVAVPVSVGWNLRQHLCWIF